MKPAKDASFAALIGIDWADRKHDVCLQLCDSTAREFSVLPHKPEAIEAWAGELRRRVDGKPVALCLEQCKGPLPYALSKYDFIVLFPVNPQTVARYRRAFTPSRAKDDPRDAEILLDLLERHGDKLTAWRPSSPQLRALQQLTEMRRRLVADKVRLTNRITASLKNYYPQALDWFKDKDTQIFCDFLLRWPSLNAAKRTRKETLLQFFQCHNARYPEINTRRVEQIKTATPLTEDDGVIHPNRLLMQALVTQLKVVLESILTFDKEIQALFSQHDDAALFQALPGAGKQFAPRLLAAFGEDRNRFPNACDLLQYAGIAPVTERSGNKSWVHWRYSCPKFLRQSFVEWAGETVRHSFWARAYYQQQRSKGKAHAVAVRALAFKWIRILHRCWLNRTPYDEARYLMVLQDKGSPLIATLNR